MKEIIKINLSELKEIIKKSVKEAIREERINLFLSIIPYVSDKEQKEIEKLYGKPSDYNEKDFEDFTNWVTE